MESVREEALFFDGGLGRSIFGVLHYPEEVSDLAIVFCNPFGEEKQFCYRPLVAFARHLARNGIPSLRFDYAGTGDSDGDSSEMTIATQIADLIQTIDLAKRSFGVQAVVLVGLRLGATVAALTAEQEVDIRALVLLSPIAEGEAYWSSLVRKEQFASIALGTKARKRNEIVEELDATGLIEIEAQILNAEMVTQLKGINLATSISRFRGPVLITGLAGDEAGRESLQSLHDRYEIIGCSAESWFDEQQDYWSLRSLYDGGLPESTFSHVTEWTKKWLLP